MATEIRVPTLGESVSEATIARWFKKPGEAVTADEPLVELETDKVTLEVNAPASGVIAEISQAEGATVEPGGLLGTIDEGGTATAAPAKKADETPAEKPAPAPKAEEAPAVQTQGYGNAPRTSLATEDHGPAVGRLARGERRRSRPGRGLGQGRARHQGRHARRHRRRRGAGDRRAGARPRADARAVAGRRRLA